MKAIVARLDARREVLMAHLEMLEEAEERGEAVASGLQVRLIASEMEAIADLYRLMFLTQVEQRWLSVKRPG